MQNRGKRADVKNCCGQKKKQGKRRYSFSILVLKI